MLTLRTGDGRFAHGDIGKPNYADLTGSSSIILNIITRGDTGRKLVILLKLAIGGLGGCMTFMTSLI